MWVRALLIVIALLGASCSDEPDVLTFSGSAVGREADVLRTQLARFTATHGVPVELRSTPDSADQRHQLYVQWLNAHADDPDVLQLDVVWTPEFAAAGWLLPLDPFRPATDDFFPAAIAANQWNGSLFGLPWFIDVGMLYWRTDLLERAPTTFDELTAAAQRAIQTGAVRQGLAWQAARYEGLITVFVEVLGGFGGRILDDEGAVVVDADPAVRALTWMRDAIHRDGIVPSATLTWQEEQARFAFQNGTSAMMRNWPYAFALLQAPDSPVAGRFAVAPMPATPDGEPTAALGGSQLAINARTTQPDDAWALVRFLTAPEQMIERARVVGQFPSRRSPYRGSALEGALGIDPSEALRIVDAAEPRPVTPVYTQLSEILQIRLHRVLTLQQEPRPALEDAARDMRTLLARVGLNPGVRP
ncbi:MAG TPA: ABC transporter substrate-binding protein [Vicinamibacterales bacterium]